MSISSSHQDLFRQPSAAEKISLVRSLMDTGDLNADVATALLKSIHSELAQPRSQNHSIYASYARLMQSLQHEMPEVHQQVVETWQAVRQAETEDVSWAEEPAETETDGKVEPKQVEESRAEEIAEPGESSDMEGKPEESESKLEGEDEQEAKQGQIEEDVEGEIEEREVEESEEDEEQEREEESEVEVNVEESKIEQEELEAKEEPEELEVAGEEVIESEKPETGEETSKAEDSEPVEESDDMATEVAEAAAHLEHAESETDVVEEEPGEEEPPER